MSFDISSPSNERVKRLKRLRSRRHRDAEGMFAVEGERLISRAISAGLAPVEAYTDRSVDIDFGIDPFTVEPVALDHASYREHSEGAIAVFEQFPTALGGIDVGAESLILAAEAIEKPGNLGAMLRIADAIGADGFVSVSGTTDLFNPNTIRASTGAVFTVPLACCELDDFSEWLASTGTRLSAATPDAPTSLWDADLSGRLALIVGAEDAGLSERLTELAQDTFSIPMAGVADSLNASVSLAIAAFEAVRRRR